MFAEIVAPTPVVENRNALPGMLNPSALLIGSPEIVPVPPVGFVTIGPLSYSTAANACDAIDAMSKAAEVSAYRESAIPAPILNAKLHYPQPRVAAAAGR